MVLRLDPSRARAMGDRVVRTARSFGIDMQGLDLLRRAHVLAMTPREERVADDHAPPYLHPGRTALILMEEGPLHDPRYVAAAMLVDTVRSDLEPSPTRVLGELGEEIAGIARSVPRLQGGESDALETLVSLEGKIAAMALAEHLDQIRHAHIGTGLEERSRLFRLTETVYLPVAQRTSRGMARRFEYVCRTFPRRFLSGGSPPG